MPRTTAKRIVLELLSATPGHEGDAANLVSAAKLLGVAENNLRVTLTRLVAAGTVELSGRGRYKLGHATAAMTRQITGWRELERGVRRWDGGWICVQLLPIPRPAARRRDRALALLGFRALDRHLALRPDNLEGGPAAARVRLAELGASGIVAFRASELDAATESRARALWATQRLSASYVQTRERIERWLVTLDALSPRAAAREAFFFGGEVLRAILFDPRLPEPLVDVAARRAMIEAAKRLDATGRRLWAALFDVAHGMVVPPAEHARVH